MANPNQSLSAKLSESYANLTEREQKLVIAMAVIVPLVVVALIIGIFTRSLDDIEAQTNAYENALELVAAGGPDYLAKKNQQSNTGGIPELFTEEVLTDNPVKLTSFIASKASAAGVKVSSYDSEELPLGSKSGSKSGPIIVEKRVKVDIRDAQNDELLKFLEEIETSGEPVVIKRIDVRGKHRSPGEVRARVEVSTFIKREQKS